MSLIGVLGRFDTYFYKTYIAFMPNNKGFRVQLSNNDKDEICKRYGDGEKAKSIAKSYKCSESMVWYLVKGMASNRNNGAYKKAVSKFNAISVEDASWIAGIVDGEGWVGVGKSKTSYSPRVSVGSADRIMAPELKKILGGSICCKPGKKDNERAQLVWDIWSLPVVRAFCEVIGPRLRVKKRHAEVLAAYCKSRMIYRTKQYSIDEQKMVKELRRLNARGKKAKEKDDAN